MLESAEHVVYFLGGSGKTQTALKYANCNRHKYPSGVFFFTARSDATLAADLARICETLQISDTSSKSQAFKQWLSQENNGNWLLIFDNADDLDAVPISDYIPKTSWGHIIITSRDQTTIGTVGETGCMLGCLSVEEAVSVLLQKAGGVLDPSPVDYSAAQDVVKLLGCLPLAIDQGGAYMRNRHKTLSTFLHLCKERQTEVLKYRPRLAEYDKTIFTTWKMNFEQVERDSEDASYLLLLFCYLDAARIPEAMLDRACSPQRRWNRIGEIFEEPPETVGINEDLIQLVRDEVRFDDAVEKLLSFSLISTEMDVNGLRIFSVHPLVQYCASEHISSKSQVDWREQAIAIVCHAFPRSEYLEPW